MKKIISFLFILIFTFCTVGCGEKQPNKSDKLKVAVSILPEETFVKKVGGDGIEVITMIPAGASPETYEPSVTEMKSLEEADIYFAIGVPAEEKILKSLPESTKVIKLHELVASRYPERAVDGGRDPHIWLSPKRAIVMVEEIAKAIGTTDSENTKQYLSELEELHNEMQRLFSDKRRKRFIIFHPSFGYFADDYGMEMIAIEQDGKEATPKQLAEIIDLAKKEGHKTVFYQAEASSKQANAFAEEIGGRAVKLEPLSPDYIKNIKRTADELQKAIADER